MDLIAAHPIAAALLGPLVGFAVAHYLRPWLKQEAEKIPVEVFGYAAEQFAKLIATGKIDEPTQALFREVAHAAFAWADKEMPDHLGDERMDFIMSRIQMLPGIGIVAVKYNGLLRELLQDEFIAWKKEIGACKRSPIITPDPNVP